MKEKLALNVIVKNEIEDVERIVAKYGKYFDEICIAVDENVEKFKIRFKDKIKVFPYKWCNDFANKRNFLVEKTESKYYFRMDCDDDIEHPELLRDSFDLMVKKGFDVIYYYYIYSRNEFGSPDAEHWRESIIKKRPDIYWKKKIHENVFVENQNTFTALRDDRIKIIHNPKPGHHEESSKRNMKFLLEEYEQDGKNTDPRTIAYLGRMYMGLGDWKKSIPFLELLTQKSGWDDDKYFGWIHLAECWKHLGNIDYAIASCNEALAINTKFPDAYLQLGAIYLQKEDFHKSLDWTMPGMVRPIPDTMFVLDPTVYGWRARMNAALGNLGIGKFDVALQYYRQARKLAPKEPFIIKTQKLFEESFEDSEFFKNFLWIVKYLQVKAPSKIPHLMEAIPKESFKDDRFYSIKHKFDKPKVWSDKSIIIYCGEAWEDWASPSVIKGIGGSEEAVIYLSKELTKLGFEVTVFNSCGSLEGTYEGVTYKDYNEFNPNDEHNIMVSWRGNIFKDNDLTAKKKFIWLHDILSPHQFTGKESETFDKLIVLSQYHKSLVELPDDKIFVSSNGINLPDFETQDIERNPKRIIYASSYDRGITNLLVMWDKVLERVPDAELHLFYGWDTYLKMEKTGFRSPKDRLAITKLMQKKNIFEHGRIGHKELVTEFYKSGVWAYPSHFQEISCITAMKAQACGCIPVIADFAALKETVKLSKKIDGKCDTPEQVIKYTNLLIDTLNNPKSQDEMRTDIIKYRSDFGWDKVALQWKNELFV